MQYKSVLVTKRGGPEAIQIVENDLRDPLPGEAGSRYWPHPYAKMTSPSGSATPHSVRDCSNL